jgi:cytochrome c biogenesis protein CcmG, thiol:disulfide interchange protein DsbE
VRKIPGETLTEAEQQPAHKKLPAWIVVLAFVLLGGFLTLVSVGYGMSKTDPVGIGYPLPDIELTTFDNKVIRSVDFQNKVVVLNFWASWCQPCEQEAAGLEQAWQTYKPRGDVVFLGVDYVDTESEALIYLKKFGVTYPNGSDLRTIISNKFRIRGVPETYIFDRKGNLAYFKIGPFSSTAEIFQAVDPLLKQE